MCLPSSPMLTTRSSALFVIPITSVLPCPRLICRPLAAQAVRSASTSSCNFSSESATSTVSSAYLILLTFRPPIFTPSKSSSSSITLWLYKENKSGDSIQPCRTPLLIWIHSVFLSPICTVAFCSQYKFLINRVSFPSKPISSSISIIFPCSTVSKAFWKSM